MIEDEKMDQHWQRLGSPSTNNHFSFLTFCVQAGRSQAFNKPVVDGVQYQGDSLATPLHTNMTNISSFDDYHPIDMLIFRTTSPKT